jgi:predicted dinucleotide-binding enzyme
MTTATIFGTGNMGTAIAGLFTEAGVETQTLNSKSTAETVTGDIVVLAVPYPALETIVAAYGDQLSGEVVVDITNPLDFSTFDSLVVPADGSAAAELAAHLPNSHVLKAFNTNFAATLSTKLVGGQPTTVLIAGDDDESKHTLIDLLSKTNLSAVDTGSLKRARTRIARIPSADPRRI